MQHVSRYNSALSKNDNTIGNLLEIIKTTFMGASNKINSSDYLYTAFAIEILTINYFVKFLIKNCGD